MHHVGEPLHVHQLGDVHRARNADPSDVVAAQVHQHYVFGPLLFAVLQLRLQGQVLFRSLAPRTGSGNGMGRHNAIFHLSHRFDGGADDVKVIQIQVVHIGGRIDAAQGAIDLEGMGVGWAGKPLGVHYLNNVPGVDIVHALTYRFLVLRLREVGTYWGRLPQNRPGRQQVRRQFQRMGEATHQLINLRGGFAISLPYIPVQADMADHLDVVAQVVEHQEGIGEHKDRLRQTLRVGRHGRHPRLKVADGVIGQVTDSPAVKTGQIRHGNEPVLAHLLLHRNQRVQLPPFLIPTGLDHPVGFGADKAVTAQLLPAGHAFQQERIRRPGDFHISGHRRFQVGVDRAVNRDQVAAP